MSSNRELPDSSYISKIRFYTHTPAREIVYAYVEGDDDVNFWSYALNAFGNTDKFDFHVETNKKASEESKEKTNKGNGKATLLTMTGLGKNKVVCVDADYDLLVKDYSEFTNEMRTCQFVINTTYYSVENVLSSPEFMKSLLSELGISSCYKEYVSGLRTVALSLRELVTYVMCPKISKKIGVTHSVPSDMKSWKYGLDPSVHQKAIEAEFKDGFVSQQSSMKENEDYLTKKGIKPEDTWQCVRGHYLYNCIIAPWIKKQKNDKINRQLSEYKRDHDSKDLEAYKKELYSKLGGFPTIQDAIKNMFYTNHPDLRWLPLPTAQRIKLLFS